MAAYSAVLRGASNVFVVDQVKERLDQAVKIGCTPINFKESDPVEQIIKANGGMVDRAVDAVGYQAMGKAGDKEQPNVVLDQCIHVTRPTGGLGIPGLYVYMPIECPELVLTPVPSQIRSIRPWCSRCTERQGTDPYQLWQAI